MSKSIPVSNLTRREALGILGFGAAAAALPAATSGLEFPKHAVIRTILKDLPPDALAGGATLFHEHLSLAPDFMPRWMAFSRASNPNAGGRANAAPPPPAPNASQTFFMEDVDVMSDELKIAAQEGVACIVDGGHPDMGRNLDFLKQISIKSGMPIVAGCGFYTKPFYPPQIEDWSD